MTADAASGLSDAIVLPATTIVANGRAVLITGASGSGKSGLALSLMALGAGLIADDRTEVFLADDRPMARAPKGLPSMIEARGIGLLAAQLQPAAAVFLIVDLDVAPQQRLPRPRHREFLGHAVPLLAGRVGQHLAAALHHILKTGHVPRHA
jgi:HPr kinase/phosphorylase